MVPEEGKINSLNRGENCGLLTKTADWPTVGQVLAGRGASRKSMTIYTGWWLSPNSPSTREHHYKPAQATCQGLPQQAWQRSRRRKNIDTES